MADLFGLLVRQAVCSPAGSVRLDLCGGKIRWWGREEDSEVCVPPDLLRWIA